MSRSSKKGPFVEERLLSKIARLNESGGKQMVRTFRGHSGDRKAEVKR